MEATGLYQSQLGGLGLDRSLFLMDLKHLNISGLPEFYHGLLKVWNLFKKERQGPQSFLFCLFQEPVIYGIGFSTVPAGRFCRSRVVTVKHVVQLAGTNMDNAAAVAFRLEVVSTRVVHQLPSKWAAAPTDGEQTLVVQYCDGSVRPDENDVFLSVNISRDFKDCTGPLLKHGNVSELFVC